MMGSLTISGWYEYSHLPVLTPEHGSALCRNINIPETAFGLKIGAIGLSVNILES